MKTKKKPAPTKEVVGSLPITVLTSRFVHDYYTIVNQRRDELGAAIEVARTSGTAWPGFHNTLVDATNAAVRYLEAAENLLQLTETLYLVAEDASPR